MADFEAANGKGGRRREIRPTAFGTQANALLLKNIAYQKRNWQTNLCLVLMPVLMCVLLAVLQIGINAVLSGDQFKCGCQTVNGVKECGIQYSDGEQIPWCPIPSPAEFPAIMQVPPNEFRAVYSPGTIPGSSNFTDLPPPSCRNVSDGCPATILYTGKDRVIADEMGDVLLNTVPKNLVIAFKALSQMQPNGSSNNGTGQMPGNMTGSSKTPFYLTFFSEYTPGTAEYPPIVYLVEPAISLGGVGGWSGATEIELLQPTCAAFRELNSTNITLTVTAAPNVPPFKLSVHCLDTLRLWRANSTVINNELYYGYNAGTNDSNEYSAAYDFQNTSRKAFNTLIWYNNTYRNSSGGQGSPPATVRFPRSMNLVANAFVKTFIDPLADIPLLFVKDFPKPGTSLSLDFSSLLGPLFYMWIMQLLFPVFTGSLVYEKEKNLRMMMKMHGLGDGPYWLISYAYFLIVSVIYMFFFIVIGSVINLKFFRINSYSIQIVFYFIFVNTQISLSVLASSVFGTVKTATVVCYLYVFGTGLLGEFLFRFFLTDENFPSWALVLLELVPAFSLYRGLYELSQSAFIGNYQGTSGTLTWSNLASSGVATVFLILAVEWLVFLLLGLYLDQVVASGSGVRKHPLFFLNCLFGGGKGGDGHHHRRFRLSMARGSTAGRQVDVDVDRADVAQEREVVDRLVSSDGGLSQGYSIVCDSLRKVYPGRDGNAEKVAVKGMSVAISRGECFGMLGPNGAGKSTSIGMMIGFLRPSGGTAWIEGMDILEDMDAIYSAMGVCPQHDLLWEQLTGREHLLFYARLKNLKGKELNEAVEESLRSVNLWNGGVGNKPAGQYSGGMKRRLSVAISLIGDPLVVYMDEPSTGLDPASRMNLWNVVKAAKKDRGIVLTTHSMEEAEQLCDRLGIFVDGQFQCIGAPRELTARYGGTYVLTLTTPPHQEQQAMALARSLSPSAKQIYSIAGTQKFELPTSEVDVADVFAAVERAKQMGSLDVQAWGVANTTLEDVFIRIAKEAQAGVTSLS